MESDAIAAYLDKAYPARPLFRGSPESIEAQHEFVGSVKKSLLTPVRYLSVVQIHRSQHQRSADYYRATREPGFGFKIEDVIPRKEEFITKLGEALDTLGKLVDEQEKAGKEILMAPVEGEDKPEPTYAAMVLIAALQWLKVMGTDGTWERAMKFGDGRWERLYEATSRYL